MANEIERRETIRIKAAGLRMCHLMGGDNTTPSVSRGEDGINQDSGGILPQEFYGQEETCSIYLMRNGDRQYAQKPEESTDDRISPHSPQAFLSISAR